jgi:3-carboxy-cis,cis-muconate cycloisomerase
VGLLSAVTVDASDAVADAVVLARLVDAEAGLMRAYVAIGAAPASVAEAAEAMRTNPHPIDAVELAQASLRGGNPVIPLLPHLAERVREHDAASAVWVHRGATSQDILDTALMLVVQGAARRAAAALRGASDAGLALAERHRDDSAIARTLTQHAVPTTLGLKAARWALALDQAATELGEFADEVPAQLGGAGGTLASFVELLGAERAAELPAVFARELGLASPLVPWHTDRAPVLRAAGALGRAVAATGFVASDVALMARTELGEAMVGSGGGSSAMPHKRNPVDAVLIRSAAMRAPGLVSTLFLAGGLAVDERPDGAWHAEWPALRELAALAVGAAERAEALLEGLSLSAEQARHHLDASAADAVSERFAIVLGPLIGAAAAASVARQLTEGVHPETLVREHPGLADVDLATLRDPDAYRGLARELTDTVARHIRGERTKP